jgi:hypothetical protein
VKRPTDEGSDYGPTSKYYKDKAKKAQNGVHVEFAERSHLLRWFHERELHELKALRKAFEQSKTTKTKTKTK